jgi:hypothetical protein
VRGNTKAELSSIDQQLAALSHPAPLRPAKTVQEALKAERVLPSVWQDSYECGRIQDSAYFMKACSQVVQLRKELAAARDYERLSLRATELRQGVAEAPIIATADPLPAAFSATLGRVLPVGGTEGVAFLLTVVVELMSCFGLGGVAVLYNTRKQREGAPAIASLPGTGRELRETMRELSTPRINPPQTLPRRPKTLPERPCIWRRETSTCWHKARKGGSLKHPPSAAAPTSDGLPGEGTSAQTSPLSSHVPDFVQQRLKRATGVSLGATELRSVYEAWCKLRGCVPLSVPKFAAAELKTLGLDKWKRSGLIRYRDIQLAA